MREHGPARRQAANEGDAQITAVGRGRGAAASGLGRPDPHRLGLARRV